MFGYKCVYVSITWDVISFNLIISLVYAILPPVPDYLVICVVTGSLSYLCCLQYNTCSVITIMCGLNVRGGV
jgi:hypothetical protein